MASNFKRGILKQKYRRQVRHDCCKEVKGSPSGETGKRYSNVSDLVLFLATMRTSFLLEMVQHFFYGRFEGPRAVACIGAALPC